MVPSPLALRAVATLGDVLEKMKPSKRPAELAFFSMVDRRKRMHLDVIQSAADSGYSYLAQNIPYASDIERMGVERRPVATFAPSSPSAFAYLSLWTQVLERLDAPNEDGSTD